MYKFLGLCIHRYLRMSKQLKIRMYLLSLERQSSISNSLLSSEESDLNTLLGEFTLQLHHGHLGIVGGHLCMWASYRNRFTVWVWLSSFVYYSHHCPWKPLRTCKWQPLHISKLPSFRPSYIIQMESVRSGHFSSPVNVVSCQLRWLSD